MTASSKRTKILCTLGPASETSRELTRMIKGGMDLARLNMSHGGHADHEARMRTLRKAADCCGRPIGLLADLQGPRLRVGDLGLSGVMLKKGRIVRLGGPKRKDTVPWLPVSFPYLAKETQPGDTILLDDGALELRAEAIDGKSVIAKVLTGGLLKSRKGINIPGRALAIPAFTPKDKSDLKFALEHQVDFVALSFVRSAADVGAVKNAMKRHGLMRPVIAKIEKRQALEDIDNIIDAADGIMVARGDLGVELSVEMVPAAQKTIIQKCTAARVWVIVATQMLESMIEHSTPTRAEASDVANAVYDGADCVMLSAETAVGSYPARTVQTMARICAAAEAATNPSPPPSSGCGRDRWRNRDRQRRPSIDAIVEAAMVLLDESDADALWVFTQSGRTARHVSKLRPAKPVYAFSPQESTIRYLSGLWGIQPVLIPEVKSTEQMIAAGDRVARERRLMRSGCGVIVLAGEAPTVGATDLIKIHRIP
jgi:pyruvate kinase